MDDGDALLFLRDGGADGFDVCVHLADELVPLCRLARERRKCSDLALYVLIAFHLDDERLDVIRRKGLNELFVHAPVKDDEVGREREDLLRVNLVDPADVRDTLCRLRDLRLRVGAADDLTADGVERFEEGCRCNDDALGFLVKADDAPVVIRDGGIAALRTLLCGGRTACREQERCRREKSQCPYAHHINSSA